ncbi:hypothetical protein VTO42DRAFT_3065 [Malbranchea cinnamomea]
MTPLFVPPSELSSSDSESLDGHDDDIQEHGANEPDAQARQLEGAKHTDENAEQRDAVDEGAPAKEPDHGGILDLKAGGHAAVMTSALLEYYCVSRAAEILNAQPGSHGKYTRDSPEAQFLGKRLYTYKSQLLSTHGVLADGVQGEDWETTRQYYRETLDMLGTAVLEELEGLDLNAIQPHRRVIDRHATAGTIGFGGPLQQTEQSSSKAISTQKLPLAKRLTDGPQPDVNNDENIPPTFMNLIPRSVPETRQIGAFSPLSPQTYSQHLGISRYAVEFEEEAMIGKGAYGAVFRVKHHVDGQVYAVKKIPLSANRLQKLQDGGLRELDNILREIRTLARLEHQNIVRYYGAWAEYANSSTTQVQTEIPTSASAARGTRGLLSQRSATEGESLSFGIVFEESSKEDVKGELGHENVHGEESDHGIVFEELSESTSESEEDAPVLTAERFRDTRMSGTVEDASDDSRDGIPRYRGREDKDDDYKNDEDDSTENGDFDDEDDIETISRRFSLPDRQPPTSSGLDEDIFTDGMGGTRSNNLVGRPLTIGGEIPPITLHIQMSLHPLSLANYLNPGANGKYPRHCFHLIPSLKIFLGVVAGVQYLHSKGIIHRDLKPANIFLSTPELTIAADGARCPACEDDGCDNTCYTVPRIGDFGLVADISPCEDDDEKAGQPILIRPVGTEFYRPPVPAAKEDENGNIKAGMPIDESLDIFALGVILFELLYKLDTRMERQMVLSDLTCSRITMGGAPVRPKLPDDFDAKVDECVKKTRRSGTVNVGTGNLSKLISECILGMVEPDSKVRWTINQVRSALETVYASVAK